MRPFSCANIKKLQHSTFISFLSSPYKAWRAFFQGHLNQCLLDFHTSHFLVFLQIAIFFQNLYNDFLMALEHHQVYFKLHHTCHILIYSISSLLLTSLCLPSCLGQSFVITESLLDINDNNSQPILPYFPTKISTVDMDSATGTCAEKLGLNIYGIWQAHH